MGELAAANKMSVKDTLKIGRTLELPAGANFVPESKRPVVKKPAPKKAAPRKIVQQSVPGDGKHIVKKGDSLWVIARTYGMSIDKLRALNGLKSDRLMPNQVLVLKGSVPVSAAVTTTQQTTTVKPVPPRSTGTVQSTAINAKITDTPTALITGTPAVSAPKLKRLPHFVLEGDTLSAVAEIYGSKVEWIKSANAGVSSDSDLKIGGKIMVPVEDID
jgi:LysM repeat protein